MLKIFKTVIKGNEGSETIDRDSKHRFTMGYDDVAKTINVKVEEVIPPSPNLDEDLPEGTDTILREPHTTATFAVVATREFNESDFAQTQDNCKWIVEYNSASKSISDPINVYEWAKQYVSDSSSHEKIYHNLNEYRYQNNEALTQLFVVDSFYKTLGFSGSSLQFFVEDYALDLMDTILETPAQEVTNKEYEFWVQYNVRPAIGFEVLDASGKVVASPLGTVNSSAKSAIEAVVEALHQRNDSGISSGLVGTNLGPDSSGNRFKVTLPAADSYSVRILSGSRLWKLIENNPAATFMLETVNGVSNKTRVALPNYTPGQPETGNVATQEFIEQHNQHPISGQNASFSGCEQVSIRTDGLRSGDYMKLKLNCGTFISYAELWVVIE